MNTNNKTCVVTVRLTQEEYNILSSNAEESMRSIGSQIRFELFGNDEVEE